MTSETFKGLEEREVFILSILDFMSTCNLGEHEKKVYQIGARLHGISIIISETLLIMFSY